MEIILRQSFRRGRFQLASGAWSDYYIDLRRTTLDPDGLVAACALLAPRISEARVAAVGGPTLGADPLVAGLMLDARARGETMQGFLVRGAPKDHGAGRQIEGHCPEGARVAILDDVVTRGGSLMRSLDAVRAAGALPVMALALVDREEGGPQLFREAGLDFYAVFRVGEILQAAEVRGI